MVLHKNWRKDLDDFLALPSPKATTAGQKRGRKKAKKEVVYAFLVPRGPPKELKLKKETSPPPVAPKDDGAKGGARPKRAAARKPAKEAKGVLQTPFWWFPLGMLIPRNVVCHEKLL